MKKVLILLLLAGNAHADEYDMAAAVMKGEFTGKSEDYGVAGDDD